MKRLHKHYIDLLQVNSNEPFQLITRNWSYRWSTFPGFSGWNQRSFHELWWPISLDEGLFAVSRSIAFRTSVFATQTAFAKGCVAISCLFLGRPGCLGEILVPQGCNAPCHWQGSVFTRFSVDIGGLAGSFSRVVTLELRSDRGHRKESSSFVSFLLVWGEEKSDQAERKRLELEDRREIRCRETWRKFDWKVFIGQPRWKIYQEFHGFKSWSKN